MPAPANRRSVRCCRRAQRIVTTHSPLPSSSHQPTSAAEQLAIEGFQFSNQALRRLMRETAQRRRRVQQTGQRHGVFFRQRGACDRRRQMPERRGGNRAAATPVATADCCAGPARSSSPRVTSSCSWRSLPEANSLLPASRSSTSSGWRRAEPASGRELKCCPSLRSSSSGLAPQQHAAVGERHVEVKAGGVLGDRVAPSARRCRRGRGW